MQIARTMAGYTLGGADELRRAMGKKKPEIMVKQRETFLSGSEANGIDRELAANIFNLVEKFAEYGFNKSHSGAYAVVSFQTAWLKHYYPAEFMTAVLSSDMQDTEKCVAFVKECQRMQLTVHPPSVNASYFKFTIDAEGAIVYGLGAVKGIGEGPVAAVATARAAGGKFIDLFDLCRRVGSRHINKRVLAALIDCGACDELITPLLPDLAARQYRSRLHAAVDDALRTAEQDEYNQAAGIVDMFGAVATPVTTQAAEVYAQYEQIQPFTHRQLLQQEKDTLGVYASGHPMDEYTQELKDQVPHSLSELGQFKKTQKWLAGLQTNLRVTKTKTGKPIAFLTLEDASGKQEVVITSKAYEQYYEVLSQADILVIKGNIQHDAYTGGFKVTAMEIHNLAMTRALRASHLELTLHQEQINPSLIKQLQDHLSVKQVQADKPANRIRIHYQNTLAKGVLECGLPWLVKVDDQLLYELRALLGDTAVALRY